MSQFDAVVVGAGPNGLAAGVELTRSGRRVLVVEGSDAIGGGTRTESLTLPGFEHDVCSAIHRLGSLRRSSALAGIGDWIQPDIPVTHPLDGGRAGALDRSLDDTVLALGSDGIATAGSSAVSSNTPMISSHRSSVRSRFHRRIR